MFPFKEIFNTFLDIVYPRFCNYCNEKIQDEDKYLCSECYKKLNPYLYNESIIEKKAYRDYVDSADSLFYFEHNSVSQRIVHMIKYEGMRNLGVQMGKRLGRKLLEDEVKADLIVPVPLHLSKKRDRGYNQSEVIAEGLAMEMNIPLETKLLKRTKFTESQTKLNRDERMTNVSEAFSISKEADLNGKTIFILDDVITTGATIAGCAKLLKGNNAKKVIALSLAYVGDNHDILHITT